MARTLYAADPASFTVAASGRIVPGTTLTVKDADGDAVTDLKAATWDADTFTWTEGAAITSVTSDDDGLIAFYGPDGYDGPLYLTGGTTAALLVRPHVVGVNLGPGVVGSTQLATGAVTSGKIAASAVTGDKVATGAISSSHIADGTVIEADVADGAVTTVKIANGAVTTAKVADAAITSGKIADDAITAAKIAADAVGSSEIAAGAVGTSELADSSVTTAKIAAGAVVEVDIADGAVTVPKLAGSYNARTSSYTILGSDSVVAIDTTSGAATLTLPAAANSTGKMLRIIKTGGTGTLTVQRVGSDVISPSSGTRTSVQFPAASSGEIVLASSGTSWHVISGRASDETVGRREWTWLGALAREGAAATVGWQMTYADTGWRSIIETDAAGVCTVGAFPTDWANTSGAAGHFRVRRQMDTVTYWGRYLNITKANTTVGLWAPTAGFTSTGYVLLASNLSTKPFAHATSSAVLLGGNDSGQYVQGHGVFLTTAAWPTTLPGTAFSAPPTGV